MIASATAATLACDGLARERVPFDRDRVLAGHRSATGDTFEDLLIDLVARLATGARDAELERAILERVAATSRRARWDVDVRLAAIWEAAAAAGRATTPHAGP